MSKLHIVIPVLNCLDLTKQTIESIVTKYEYTVHIVDQDSDISMKNWCNEMKLRSPDRFFYHEYRPMVALSEAWNRGMSESLKDSECEYVFFPNNDVIFHKTTIDNLIKGIDELNYMMVTGENVAPKMTIEDMKSREKMGDWEWDSRQITSWMDQGPDFSCFMVKRDFREKFGYFDENFYPAYCEDQDVHIRILKMSEVAKRLTVAPYYHLSSQTLVNNSTISPTIKKGHGDNQVYYRYKWGVDHANALNGEGYGKPYNQDRDIKYWSGVEKYD